VGRDSVFPVLSGLAAALRACPRPEWAVESLEQSKASLYTLLRCRFPAVAAQALVLKLLNICLAKHHLEARHAKLLSRPFGLVADPSNTCRLACPGCVHSARSRERRLFDWPNGMLAADRMASLLRLYGPHAVGVYLCNYGEPLLNLETPRFIRMAKSYLLNVALSTTLCVPRFDPEAYVESGLDFMLLAIDGATQPVYGRLRRNGDLELVLENVRRLVGARRRLKRRTPVLAWNFLAFEHNVHEIPLARKMARRIGVDDFRVALPFDVGWDDPDIRPAAVKPRVLPLRWRPDGSTDAPASLDTDTIGRAFEHPWNAANVDTMQPDPGRTCHWLYKNIAIDAAGRILPCCCAPQPGENMVFGALDGRTDPFNSGQYRAARRFFRTGTAAPDPAPYCTHCDWDQTTVNIGGPEIRCYFQSADADFFDRPALELLSAW
jgi:MoaA/NifB/PqqE/SkfB family radical SAM enzyme